MISQEFSVQLFTAVVDVRCFVFENGVKFKNPISPTRRPTHRPTRRPTVGSVLADVLADALVGSDS